MRRTRFPFPSASYRIAVGNLLTCYDDIILRARRRLAWFSEPHCNALEWPTLGPRRNEGHSEARDTEGMTGQTSVLRREEPPPASPRLQGQAEVADPDWSWCAPPIR
jgi:hypothetical protein